MHTFFHGWRRKTGCVTLVLACMVVGLWMRSYINCDQLSFRTGEMTTDTVSSLDGILTWSRFRNKEPQRQHQLNQWQSIPSLAANVFFSPTIEVEWQWYGFGFTKHVNEDYSIFEGCLIPYWSVTIPLTLLSACLILWKPRHPPKPTDPGNGFSQRHKVMEKDETIHRPL